MAIYKYQRIVTPGPNGTTLYFTQSPNNDGIEIAELAGWYYVFAPDTVTMPAQNSLINWQVVTPDATLFSEIKAVSRPCQVISDAMQAQIRAQYSLEDELYFARITIGVLTGMYTYQTGEQSAVQAFGTFVENVRQWGVTQRAAIGLP